MREHDGMERHRVLAEGLGAAAFEPGEEVEIGRRLRVPDLFDLANAHAAELGQHMLHRVRGHADAQARAGRA